MLPYLATAVVITHAFPNVWSWGWWGAKTVCQSTYWLFYGRFEEARREQRLRQLLQEEIEKAILELKELPDQAVLEEIDKDLLSINTNLCKIETTVQQKKEKMQADLHNMELVVGGTDLILVRRQ